MKHYRILIVDRDAGFCAQVKEKLERYNCFTVMPALYNGKDALKAIEETRPDVLLMDLVMPGYDAFYILDYIQKYMDGYVPFTYILTAIDSVSVTGLLKKKGADYFSIKPVTPASVANNLSQLVLQKRGGSQGQAAPTLDNATESFLYQLGAPLHLLSTKCAAYTIKRCMENEELLLSITTLYKIIAESWSHGATPWAVERNIRTLIKNMQKNDYPLFRQCFPYGDKKLTNSHFLNSAVYFLKRNVEEQYGGSVLLEMTKKAQ